jgi:hypothetical protein
VSVPPEAQAAPRLRRALAAALVAVALAVATASLGAKAPAHRPAPAKAKPATGAHAAVTPAKPPAGAHAAAAPAKPHAALVPRPAPTSTYPAGTGQAIAERACLFCHSPMLVTQQAKDSTGWEKTLGQMEKWGAPVNAAEHDTLRRYLLARYGPRPMPAAPATATPTK